MNQYDILIVGNDITNIEKLTNYFVNYQKIYGGNHRITFKVVANGKEALEELNKPPRMILMNTAVGYEQCKTIKSNPKGKYIPIILLISVNRSRSEAEKYLTETSADGYILHPYIMGDFHKVIEKYILFFEKEIPDPYLHRILGGNFGEF